MIKTYSNKRDGNKQLSPHFKVREFAEQGNDEIKIDDRLLPLLEAIYAALDCTKIIITSGYRTDQNASRHAEGRAADINCWHMVDGKEVRYQGQEILLAAEDAGVPGIGWIAGSATSRAAVHIDTRDTPYRFDEANGNRMVKDNSWYAYFGVPKPGTETPPDIIYQVYAKGKKWLAEITNYGDGSNGYAGWPKRAVQGVRAKLSRGHIGIRVHIGGAKGRWLPWVVDGDGDYAGLYGKDADGIQMHLVDALGYVVEYRVAAKGKDYYPWVRDYGDGSDGYAGCYGKAFDRLQCRIVQV